MCGGGNCCDGVCSKCHAGKKVVLGALVLANAFFGPWKVTSGADTLTNWIAFFAVLFIIKGVLKFVMPNCPHCKAEMPAKMSGKKGK